MSTKKLGFGLMRLPLLNPNDETSIDIEQMKQMVDTFIERGFTYFDTAWMYCGYKSENATKEALVDRHPRDSYTLATKLNAFYIETKEDRDKIFNEQLHKTGATFFDYYLLHAVEGGNYEKYEKLECFDWILEKKEQGLIRHAGFSFHGDAELLDKVLTKHPEMEFVQLQINYLDWDNEWIQSGKCYDVAVKHGKQVIVMEPVKGGTLANVPAEVADIFKSANPELSISSWAIRFAASLENVMVVLSGMSNMEQLLDNTSYMADFQPLTEEEKAVIDRALTVIKTAIAIPCTGCSYCTDGCPMKINIPKYFALYNNAMQLNLGAGRTPNHDEYESLTKDFGKASACVACGQCEGVCPQHLPIIEHLKDVSKHFEG